MYPFNMIFTKILKMGWVLFFPGVDTEVDMEIRMNRKTGKKSSVVGISPADIKTYHKAPAIKMV